MWRWTRRIITFFSFILFAGSAYMCVRSYRQVDFITHQQIERTGSKLTLDQRLLVSGRGGACLGIRHTVWTLPHPEMSEEQIASLQNGWQHELMPTSGYGGEFFKSTRQPIKFGFGGGKVEK